jgi:hypothetical protein
MSGANSSPERESREGDLELLRSLLFRGPIARDALAQAYADAHDVDLESADRLARKDIEEARKTTDWGEMILSNPYRFAISEEDMAKMERFLASERRRGLSILMRVRRQRRGLDRYKALPLRQGDLF